MKTSPFFKKCASLVLAIAVTTTAAPLPARAADDEITGEIQMMIGDDFAAKKDRVVREIREEKTGKVFRLEVKKAGAGFEAGERVRVKNFKRLSPNAIEIPDDGTTHVQRVIGERPSKDFRRGSRPLAPAPSVAASGGPSQAPLVPVFNSNPSATAQLFLDFDGAFISNWGGYTNITVKVFDQDGNYATFSAGETATILEICRRVAENFSPFNINVTTVDPGNESEQVTARVTMGGSWTDWYGASAGGVAYIGGFYNGSPNTGHVFEDNLGNGDPKYCAVAASHEAGHLFGLLHQSTWVGTTRTEDYSSGNGFWAPLMGIAYSATKGIWHNGTSSTCNSCTQLDLTILANASNAFGVRTDDRGATVGTASPVTLTGNTGQATGIIETMTDADWYQVTLPGGNLIVNLTVPQPNANEGPMLDSTLALYDAAGTLIQTVDTASLSESLSQAVLAGDYHIGVSGKGAYGDVGQYKMALQIIPAGSDVTPPVLSSIGASGVTHNAATIAWTTDENSDTQVEYGLTTSYGLSTTLNMSMITSHSQNLSGLAASSVYHYRVKSRDVSGNLATSADRTFTTSAPPNNPPLASAQTVSLNRGASKNITLTGGDADGNPLTYAVVTSPAHGTLSGTAPSLVYTPEAAYIGSDSFTFRTNDGQANSAAATVTINVLEGPTVGNGAVAVVRNVLSPGQGRDATLLLNGLAGETLVDVTVFDRAGNVVREFQQSASASASNVTWDGRNDSQNLVASGAYYLRLRYAGKTVTTTVVVVK